jgi:hypothetical protein
VAEGPSTATHLLVAVGAVDGEDARVPLRVDDASSPAAVKELLWQAWLALDGFVGAGAEEEGAA